MIIKKIIFGIYFERRASENEWVIVKVDTIENECF